MNAKNFYVGGINAVGKSTILRRTAELVPGTEIFSGSKELLAYAGFDSYEGLWARSQRENGRDWARVVRDRLKSREAPITLFDSHFANMRFGHLSNRVADWIADMDGLVLIEASVDDVWNHIQSELATRGERGLFPEGATDTRKRELLQRFADFERQVAEQASKQYDKPLLIVTRRHDNLESNAAKIAEFVN